MLNAIVMTWAEKPKNTTSMTSTAATPTMTRTSNRPMRWIFSSGVAGLGTALTRLTHALATGDVLDEPDHHADTGGGESHVITHGVGEEAHHERGDERAEVDAHVEQRETTIAAGVVRRIQVTDDRGDAGLEQTGADGDRDEAEPEHDLDRNRHREVPGRDDDAARTAPLAGDR